MNGEKMMMLVEQIDDELIIEADRNMPKHMRFTAALQGNRKLWLSIASAAAVVVLALVLLLGEWQQIPDGGYHPSGLPMLAMGDRIADFGDGFGGQAFDVTDIAQAIGNPPNIMDMHIETLPVFRSPMRFLYWGTLPIALDTPDTSAMLAEIERIAALMGLSMDDMDEITFYTIHDHLWGWDEFMRNPNMFDDEFGENFADRVISATAYWGDFSIEVSNTNLPHRITIRLPIDDFPMPPTINERFEDNFTSYDVTDEQAKLLMEYFMEYFASIVGFNAPAIDITSGYYFIPNESPTFFRSWDSFTAYETGDYTESILGYNFNRVYFVSGIEFDDGFISPYASRHANHARIELHRPDFLLSQKIGDYPVISQEEARQLLIEGQYLTNVFMDYILAEEFIAHVDLVYLTRWQETFMPFYRFTVELPPMNEHFERLNEEYGMKTYGWFFVPAVRSEFFTDWLLPPEYIPFQ